MMSNLLYNELKTLKAECLEHPHKYHKLIMWHLEEKFNHYIHVKMNEDAFINYFQASLRIMNELEDMFE